MFSCAITSVRTTVVMVTSGLANGLMRLTTLQAHLNTNLGAPATPITKMSNIIRLNELI